MSRLLGRPTATVVDMLEDEQRRGTVVHHTGRLSGWSLTTEGRAEGEQLLAAELDRNRRRGDLEAGYREFLELNRELLAICAAWQTVTIDGVEVVNDHSDSSHDRSVLTRLDVLHERALRLTASLASSSSRFGGYSQRLRGAHARIVAGETEWLTRSTIDSYHTVWFELHENLLANLGRRRSQERQS